MHFPRGDDEVEDEVEDELEDEEEDEEVDEHELRSLLIPSWRCSLETRARSLGRRSSSLERRTPRRRRR